MVGKFIESLFQYRGVILFLFGVVIWFLPFIYGAYWKNQYKIINYKYNELFDSYTITDTMRETVCIATKYYEPIVIKQTQIKRDTVNLMSKNGDSVEVIVPIEQKTYKKDSVYQVWVSGYKTNLDSIEVFQKNTQTIIRENRIINQKDKKFGVGIIGGYGYDFISKKGAPMIGVGISYNFFKF